MYVHAALTLVIHLTSPGCTTMPQASRGWQQPSLPAWWRWDSASPAQDSSGSGLCRPTRRTRRSLRGPAIFMCADLVQAAIEDDARRLPCNVECHPQLMDALIWQSFFYQRSMSEMRADLEVDYEILKDVEIDMPATARRESRLMKGDAEFPYACNAINTICKVLYTNAWAQCLSPRAPRRAHGNPLWCSGGGWAVRSGI